MERRRTPTQDPSTYLQRRARRRSPHEGRTQPAKGFCQGDAGCRGGEQRHAEGLGCFSRAREQVLGWLGSVEIQPTPAGVMRQRTWRAQRRVARPPGTVEVKRMLCRAWGGARAHKERAAECDDLRNMC